MSYLYLHELPSEEGPNPLDVAECGFCHIHRLEATMLFDEELGKNFCDSDCLRDYLIENAEGM